MPPPLPDHAVSLWMVRLALRVSVVPPEEAIQGELAGKSTLVGLGWPGKPSGGLLVPQSCDPLSPEDANRVWPSAAPCKNRSLSAATSFGSAPASHEPHDVVTTSTRGSTTVASYTSSKVELRLSAPSYTKTFAPGALEVVCSTSSVVSSFCPASGMPWLTGSSTSLRYT